VVAYVYIPQVSRVQGCLEHEVVRRTRVGGVRAVSVASNFACPPVSRSSMGEAPRARATLLGERGISESRHWPPG
jgi:hypothetical protein